MAPILEKIMAGKEASPFILVKDTLEQSGQVLGLQLLSNSPSEYVTSIAPIQRARLISSSITFRAKGLTSRNYLSNVLAMLSFSCAQRQHLIDSCLLSKETKSK